MNRYKGDTRVYQLVPHKASQAHWLLNAYFLSMQYSHACQKGTAYRSKADDTMHDENWKH